MPSSQEWQRSPVGITPIVVRPRAGCRIVTKKDSEWSNNDQATSSEIKIPNRAATDELSVSVRGESEKSRQTAQLGRVCSVCTRATASYSCPRCLIAYCSSKCYKAHGTRCTEAFFREHVERETKIREAEEEDTAGGGGGGARERRAKMVEILTRARRRAASPYSSCASEDGCSVTEGGAYGLGSGDASDRDTGDSPEGEPPISEACPGDGGGGGGGGGIEGGRLEALAQALGVCDISDGSLDSTSRDRVVAGGGAESPRESAAGGNGDTDVMDILTSEERARFLREIASGRLGKLIVPWVPWWTKSGGIQEVMMEGGYRGRKDSKLSSSSLVVPTTHSDEKPGEQWLPSPGEVGQKTQPPSPEDSGSSLASRSVVSPVQAGFDSDEACELHTFEALLSRVREAPDFSTLSARDPSPTLPALAVDLAYAYVLVARLYNGCWCADPVGASMALVGASPVLRDSATPPSAAEALASCVACVIEGGGVHSRSYAESLRKNLSVRGTHDGQDVLMLCEDSRKLMCAFQDMWAMFDAAGRALAPATGGRRLSSKCSPAEKLKMKNQRRSAKELGKVEKRIGYFLLWARSHGDDVAPAMAADVLRAQVSCADLEAYTGVRG